MYQNENKNHLLDEVNLEKVILEKDVKKLQIVNRNHFKLEMTKKKVFEALKLFKNDKSPGTDGFILDPIY